MTSQPDEQKNKHDIHAHDSGRMWGRIANLKIELVIVSLILLTVFFYIGGAWAKVQVAPNWQWIDAIPWESLASACLGSFLVAFAYEWFIRNETDAKLARTLEQYFQSHEQALGNEIARAMVTHRDVMKDVLSPTGVEAVIRTGLEIRLGDNQLAKEVYDSQLSHLLTYKERRSNYRCNIYMTTLKNGDFPEDVKLRYYGVYIDVWYDTHLQKDTFRFTCVSNMENYCELLRDPQHELRWFAEPTPQFPDLDVSVFDVESATISTQNARIMLDIQRETIGNQFVITAKHAQLSSLIGQSVKVHYRYKAKLQKRGHLLMTHIPCPTHNVAVELDYAHTDILFVNVLDFFGGETSPSILHIPSDRKHHKVEIDANGWVFPMAGVVFAWVLRSEMTSDFVKLMSDSSAAN